MSRSLIANGYFCVNFLIMNTALFICKRIHIIDSLWILLIATIYN